ncbi:hypothetical protein [Deinococcus metallilatus]|nr:hypothetical protein [Deinococcus metallilatus]
MTSSMQGIGSTFERNGERIQVRVWEMLGLTVVLLTHSGGTNTTTSGS